MSRAASFVLSGARLVLASDFIIGALFASLLGRNAARRRERLRKQARSGWQSQCTGL